MPRWLEQGPAPDLVTVCFGGNDWESGMRDELFHEVCVDTIDRIRRATNGKADVMFMTTVPALKQWKTRSELGEACRRATRERKAALADSEQAFWGAGSDKPDRLFAWDGVHLSAAGHELMAATVLKALGF
jgi:lysophospholipase L1-like esterase